MEEWIWVGVVGVEGGRWDSGGGRRGGWWEEEMGFLLWVGVVVWAGKKGGGGEGVSFVAGVGYKVGMRAQELSRECDQILKTKKFRDYPGAKNGLQVTHGRQV